MKKISFSYYFLTVAAAALYLYLTFNTPADPVAMERYQLTAQGLFLLRISFIFPVLFIWFAGTYAFTILSHHVHLVRGGKEEKAFRALRTGLGIIFWGGSVLASLTGVIGNYIGRGVSDYPLRPVFTILGNYLGVFPLLLGFAFILFSAGLFFRQAPGIKVMSRNRILVMGAALLPVAYVFLNLIFSDATRTVPTAAARVATYYLPDPLIVLTLILPLFASWIMGLLATGKLNLYASFVEGKLYKKLFANFALGLNVLIFLSMFLRTLTSIGTGRLAVLGLDSILAIIYVIFLVAGAAYLFIARGVRKLSQIEMVA